MSVEPTPPVAQEVFGAHAGRAAQYAQLLATDGIVRGLLGPREAERIWTRHVLNGVALTELLPGGARVVDVGSGAGIPGIVLAIRRPDLRVDLVEPLLRRCEFLGETIERLALCGQVRVVRGRAEDKTVRATVGRVQWVVARAVAPIDRLARWCLPLLEPGGQLLALKGTAAQAEVADAGTTLRRLGGRASVVECGRDATRVTVVRVERSPQEGTSGDRR